MNIARLENKRVIVSEKVGIPVYDFNFELHFQCDHPGAFDAPEPCVLRLGAIQKYEAEYTQKLECNLELVNTPAQQAGGLSSNATMRRNQGYAAVRPGKLWRSILDQV